MSNSPIGQASAGTGMVIAWEPGAARTDPAVLREARPLVQLGPEGYTMGTDLISDWKAFERYDNGPTTPEDIIHSAEWKGGYQRTDEELYDPRNTPGPYGRGLEVKHVLARKGGFTLVSKGKYPDFWLEDVGRFKIYNPQNVKSLHLNVAVKMPTHDGDWDTIRQAGVYDRTIFVGLADAFKPELAYRG